MKSAEPNRVQRFGHGTDLIDLDQDRVGDAAIDANLDPLGIGHEEVISNELHLAAEGV